MKKLILILLAFFAVFTYLRTFDVAEAGEMKNETAKHVEIVR